MNKNALNNMFTRLCFMLMLLVGCPNYLHCQTITVTASADSEQTGSVIYADDNEYQYVYWGSYDQYAAFRFDPINIPDGSTITSARLVFWDTKHRPSYHNDPLVTVYGERKAAPANFTFNANDISSRSLTTSSVGWQPYSDKFTPDIKDLITEIMSLSTASARTFVLITKSSKTSNDQWISVASQEQNQAQKRPQLEITYTSPLQAIIAPTPLSLGPSAFVNYNATSQSFTLSETSGTTDFIGDVTVSATWLSVSIPNGGFTAAHPLVKGTTQTVTVNYSTTGLAAGTYGATITISGNASNSPRTINVSLLVKETASTAACGEIPLYAENKSDPAIMIQLDTSGSMSTQMPILASGKNPRTPSLTTIVQEIVNRQPVIDPDPLKSTDGWQALNEMAFVISGTGKRVAYSYDGQSVGSPKLFIAYTNALGASVEKEYPIAKSNGDVQKLGTTLKGDADYLELGRAGEPVGLLFEDIDIPNSAVITKAEIQFVISNGNSVTTTLTINGVNQDTAPPFITANQLTSDLTSSSVAWSVESWSNTMTRINIAEDVLKEVFLDRSISWGFATWAGGNCGSGETPPTNDWTTYRVGIHTHDAAHQAYLQDKADDGSADGCTPLAPTMHAALQYYKGFRTDLTYTPATYTPLSCQPKIVVFVTDGIGNTATTMALVETRVNALLDEGISVVAVGFGIDEAEAGMLYKIAQIAQTRGKTSTTDTLYALHHEDAGGVGVPYLAQSREDFINAMAAIVSSVKAQVFYGSAPAASTSVDNGEVLLASTFNAADWSGDLTATKFNAITGVLEATPIWTAKGSNPSKSNINGYIFNTSSATQVSAYTDASLPTDNFLCKIFGDIINSTPKIVGKPPYWHDFDEYNKFKYNTNIYNRPAVAYVAANDGALHAFNLSTGLEKWRFYPESVKAKLNEMALIPSKDMCSTAYCHRFLFDGSPQAADVYDSTKWRTILVAGLGRGGSSYIGLDITYGNNFATATGSFAEKDTPSTYLWEFTDSTLGLATSFPEIDRVVESGSTTTATSTWIVLLGSGERENAVDQLNQKAYLYGFSAIDKSAVWLDASHNAILKIQLAPSDLFDDIPASPVSLDINDDNLADRVYMGNMYGNMYRVANIGNGQTPTVSTFFYSGKTDHSSPTLSKPAFAFAGDPNKNTIQDIWVYFGTGIFEKQTDKFTDFQQYFYGLFDQEASLKNDSNPQKAAYVSGDLYNFTTTIVSAYAIDTNGARVDLNGDGSITTADMREYRTVSCASPTTDGKCNVNNLSWKLALYKPSGKSSERVITRPLVNAGIVYFASFIPDGDPCEGNGDSWLFAVDYKTGDIAPNAVFDINKDSKFTEKDTIVETSDGTKVKVAGFKIGDSPPNELVLDGNTIIVGDKDSPATGIPINPKNNMARLRSWRQLINN